MASEDEQVIEAAFLASWDGLERGFENFKDSRRAWNSWARTMLTVIKMLRAQGYDRHFLIFTSLTTLVLSRSRKRGGFPRLEILMQEGGGVKLTYRETGSERIETDVDRIAITIEFEEWLQYLLSRPINEAT